MNQKTEAPKLYAVYFGYLDVIEPTLNEYFDDEVLDITKISQVNRDIRSKIISSLNRYGEILEICDLFDESPASLQLDLDPILFSVRLPPSLHKEIYQWEEPEIKPDKFWVVYDGELVMIAAEGRRITKTKRKFRSSLVSGVCDVRDFLLDFLKEAGYSPTVVPPTITHEAIVFVEGQKPSLQHNGDLVITLTELPHIKEILRLVYESLNIDMKLFYSASSLSHKLRKLISQLQRENETMLNYLREFLEISRINLWKKQKLIKPIKSSILNVLKILAEYNSAYSEFQGYLRDIKERMNDHQLSKDFLDAIRWNEYIEIENNIDMEQVLKSSEFARKEIETFSLTSTTIIAAIVAAIVSSIINLLFKFL